jgi:hypothetical protein
MISRVRRIYGHRKKSSLQSKDLGLITFTVLAGNPVAYHVIKEAF